MTVKKGVVLIWIICLGVVSFSGCASVLTVETEQEDRRVSGEGQQAAGPEVEGTFRKVVLVEEVTRPNVLEIDASGRVFFAERDGAVRVWEPETGQTSMVGFIPVHAVHTSGLLGMALDPDFEDNGWMYLYYAPHDETRNELARLTVKDGRFVPESKRVLLGVPVERYVDGGHSAGELEFGPDGNLYLSTGDNTNPRATGYAPIDERPGRKKWDAQRSSANTMDLRGKILRIRPEPDGGYAIPEGNLFPYGVQGRPEIYTMGHRNPYRFKIDPKTGGLYWGEVGPDAGVRNEERGPVGHDEFNRAHKPGNYGWPYFVGDNKAYRDYDFVTETSGVRFNPERPVNESPRNTGARILPPAQPAVIWYPHGDSKTFPELGAGGRAAMAGPVYRYRSETASSHAPPQRYDGSLFIFEFMRNWIKEVRFDQKGQLAEIRPFLPEMEFKRPMDMEVGPDGRLYLIEWGSSYEGWYNPDAQIVRLDYHSVSESAAPEARTASTSRRAEPSLSIQWPVEGGVFDFNRPLRYRVAAAEAPKDQQRIAVRPHLGHDTHQHAQRLQEGRQGRVRIQPDETHLYLEDHFVLLEAGYQQTGSSVAGIIPADTVRLQPRQMQAEHTVDWSGIDREITGDSEGGNPLRVRRNVEVYVTVEDGGYLGYGPINLLRIDELLLRLQPLAGGTIEVRTGAPDGPLLGERRVEPAGEGDSWTELSLPVHNPGGPQSLYLVFTGEAEEPLMKVDWIRFKGQGVMGAPPPQLTENN